MAVDTVRDLTNPPIGYVWYPHPQVDDRILLIPHFEDINPSFQIRLQWYDAIPRIPLMSATYPSPGTFDVQVDVSSGSGVPWAPDA